jgi:hypothetical protein
MRRAPAILLAIWATAACVAVDGNAAVPPTPLAAEARPTQAPLLTATRVAWPPMAAAPADGTVTMLPGLAPYVTAPALVPAGKELAEQSQLFTTQFAPHFIDSLQHIRYGEFHGSEPYMFATMFGPSAFADGVRDLLQTGHADQTRFFVFRSASLDRGWRGQNGVMLIEGTIAFDDEVGMSESHWYEPHTWTIRGLGQSGSFFVVDGAELGSGMLGPVAGFDTRTLDGEVARQVINHLSEEQASPGGGRPVSPYNGTAYWDARKAALDQLFSLAERGVLTDRHFEGITAQVTEFTPTSYLGDGLVTVHLIGTLVEVMRGERHAYPVDELVRFQRTASAQAIWLAVDGNDGSGWLMHGDYSAAPISLGHG